MSKEQLQIIAELLEYATETNWTAIAERISAVYSPEEVKGAWDALNSSVGRSSSIDLDDFFQ